MTSRLRCLVQATTKRTTSLQYSPGAAKPHTHNASVDRYTAIRSFFNQNRQSPTRLHVDKPTFKEASWSSPHWRSSSQLETCTFRLSSSIRQLHRSATLRTSSTTNNRGLSTKHTSHDDTSHRASSSSPTNAPEPHSPPTPPPEKPPNLENYSEFFRRLALSLPHLHRPTKDDFLNVASGFWQRARIRFKWFTIKSFRNYNADDISAFLTVLLMSQTLWVLVGTTTFLSVVFALVNSLRLQEYVARAISDYLTSETGVTIIFESAIVPKWKDSRISFKNVYISRRPISASHPPSKGDIGHRAAAGYDVANHPSFFHHDDEHEHDHEAAQDPEDELEGDGYSMFDLTVDSVDVTLSLWRWLDGKGMIEDAVVKGVRGVLDRRSVIYEPGLEPADFRHPARPGDFQLDSLQLEDVLITVYQPGGFRPYTASIFHANMKAFRKNFLFYDLLNAESVVGQFDGCLFSLHRPQSIGRTHEMDLREGDRSRMTRIRIDGVNIDHLQGATTSASGPVSWITSGKVDAVLDITFPRDASSPALNEILGEIADSITSSLVLDILPGQRELAKPPLSVPEDSRQHHGHNSRSLGSRREGAQDEDSGDAELRKERSLKVEPEQKVLVDIDLRFRDMKAAVPMFPGELSYVNSALVRPIVAFINANRVLVPIRCRVVKDLSDFEGAWTMWEAGLTDDISLKIYEALAYHVSQINMNRRIKTVSVWSLHLTVNALLAALRNAMDPVTAHLRELYAREYESALRAGMASFAS